MLLPRSLQSQFAMRCVAPVGALVLLGGCAEAFYARTATGTIAGKLDVEWVAPNQFIFHPREDDPLRFVTSDGHTIQPQTMYTDGGSIPRFFWSVPDLGPWDFAPGFVIHDWLFEQQHCQLGDYKSYTFDRSAEILAEAIKTQMVQGPQQDPAALWLIYQGVKTPIAEKLWNSGKCKGPQGMRKCCTGC